MGGYLCEVEHPDHVAMTYPVFVRRQEDWSGVPPGADAPHPVALPRAQDLEPDVCYVPQGWCLVGDDLVQVWCDGFLIQRFPVTNRQYIAFLDDLVDRGRADEALALAPQVYGGASGTAGQQLYARDEAGHFHTTTDADGDTWDPEWPVVMVSWGCAVAYARWWSEKTGEDWRLPTSTSARRRREGPTDAPSRGATTARRVGHESTATPRSAR